MYALIIVVVQPSGRQVNSLGQFDEGIQLVHSSFLWGPCPLRTGVILSVLILQQFQHVNMLTCQYVMLSTCPVVHMSKCCGDLIKNVLISS